jgi:L-cysteine S-thiosulfotransferase
MSRATQWLQDDDAQNPAFLWVKDGRERFAASCSGCHQPADMGTVATRYPAFDGSTGQPISLLGRIRQCHSLRMGVTPPAPDSEDLIALESYIAHAARGQRIVASTDKRLLPFIEQGLRWWQLRQGQLDLSCADCHDRLAGQRLAGSTIPQGHPTGYPIYRLEWQGMGSVQRRLRGCLTGVRAEPFAHDDEAWTALELYLKQRAAGMVMDAPAVRP